MSSNYWVQRGTIPLGVGLDVPLVYKRMPYISDNIIVAGMPGSGKSVIARSLIKFISMSRPVVVFDWEGEDHKLSYLPNSQPENLPPYTRPEPVDRAIFLNYTKHCEAHEYRTIPNLTNYNSDELRALGFPPVAAMKLSEILNTYGPFESMQELLLFIKPFPTNERDCARVMKQFQNAKRNYKQNDTMPTQTKQSLLIHLYRITEKELFSLTNENYYNIVELLQKGYNVFLNFRGEVDVARVEITKVYDQIIQYRKNNPYGVAPYIFIEEGDRIIPKQIDDSEEKRKSQYVQLKIIESYKRARKLKLGQCFITPSLSNLDRTIIDLSFEKIFGRMQGLDLMEVRRCSGEWTMWKVARLKFDRYKGIREFVYRDEFSHTWTFIPYACPQEMHREY